MTTTANQPQAGNRTNAPARIQRQRIKGWTTPTCRCGCGKPARYVGRGSKYGNPFILGHPQYGLVHYGPEHQDRFGREWDYEGRISAAGASHDMWFSRDDVVKTYVRLATREEVVELFRLAILDPTPAMKMAYPSRNGHLVDLTVEQIQADLAGHDLMCWCPAGRQCHADVLIHLANRGAA